MKRLTALSLGIVVLFSAAAPEARAADVKGFESTWKAAQQAAEKKNKPIYIHFTTTWCGWCRRIENDTYASQKGKGVLEDFVAVSLDCTVQGGEATGETKVNRDLMGKYGGSGYPFLVMTTPDGTLLHKFSGYVDPEGFQREAKVALEAWKEFKEFRDYAAKADKSSMEYNVKALKFYSKVDNFEKAAEPAKRVLKEKPDHELALQAHHVLFMTMMQQDKDDQAKSHFQKILELDKTNEKGFVEEAVWAKVNHLAEGLNRSTGQEEGKKILGSIASELERLTAEGLQLEDPVRTYFILGNLHNTLENKDKAVKYWKVALSHNPPGRLEQEIKNRIESATQDSE
jgi:thioredoxin-related protein